MSSSKKSSTKGEPIDVEQRLRDNGMEARRTLESRSSDHSLYSFQRRGYVEKNRRHVGSYKDSQLFRSQARTEVGGDGARSVENRGGKKPSSHATGLSHRQAFREPHSRGYNPYQ